MPSKQQLTLIHVAVSRLKMTDENYRDLLFGRFGVMSSKNLDNRQVEELLKEFEKLGWRRKSPQPSLQGGVKSPSPSRGGRVGMGKKYDDLGVRSGMATPKQLRLIEVTWMNNPNVQAKTPEALRRFIEHRFKISNLRFVEDRDVGKVLTAIRSIKAGRIISPQSH